MPKGNERADPRINSIGVEVEFRNQQVASSILAGGSSFIFNGLRGLHQAEIGDFLGVVSTIPADNYLLTDLSAGSST